MAKKKSWKTTATGIVSIVLGLAFGAIALLGLPVEGIQTDTETAGQLISAGLGIFGVTNGLQGMFAQDDDKSSGDVSAGGI